MWLYVGDRGGVIERRGVDFGGGSPCLGILNVVFLRGGLTGVGIFVCVCYFF